MADTQDTLEKEVLRMERQNVWAAGAGETSDDSGNKLLLEAMAIVTDRSYDLRKPPSMGGLASVGQEITSRLNLYCRNASRIENLSRPM
jgi:hypothetical protein